MRFNRIVNALLFLLLFPIGLPVLSQDNFPVVRYKQQAIIDEIPYGKVFVIKGDAVFPDGTPAERVILSIYEKNRKETSIIDTLAPPPCFVP